MKYFITTFVFVPLIFIMGCIKDAEFLPKEYPVVLTNEPIVGSESVLFSANLSQLGNSKIISYGFVWSLHPGPTLADRSKLFKNDIAAGEYSYTANQDFKSGLKYYVRAYVKTAEYEVYGVEKSFISSGSLPPVITGFTPAYGSVGTQVIITGYNLAESKDDIIVKFGTVQANIDSIVENKIFVQVPEIQKSGKLSISIEIAGMPCISVDLFDLLDPWEKIAAFTIDFSYPTSFAINNKGYIINANSTVLTVFDPVSKKLTSEIQLPENPGPYPLSTASTDIGYVLLNQNLYQFDPTSNTWKFNCEFGYTRTANDYIFLLNNEIYIGSTGLGFYAYKENEKRWVKKTTPILKYSYSYHSINNEGYLFCIGGIDAYKYNPANDLWVSVINLPWLKDYGRGQFFINNIIYANLHDFWQFDLSNNKWKKLSNCPANFSGFFFYLCMTIEGKGYAFITSATIAGEWDLWAFNPEKK